VLEVPQFVLDRAAAEKPIFAADEVDRWPKELFAFLECYELIRETDNASSVVCDACGRDHVEPVIKLPLPDGTGFRAYMVCELEGRVPVPLRRLRQWMLNVPKLSEMTGWSPSGLVHESVKAETGKWQAAPLPEPPTPAPIFEEQDFMATDFDFSAFFGDVQDVLDGISVLTRVILGLPRPPVPLTALHTVRPEDREKYDSQMATYREQHPKAMEAIHTAGINLDRLLAEDRFVESLAGVWPPSAPKDLTGSISLGLRNALAAARGASKCTLAPAGGHIEGFKRSAVTAEYTLTGIVAKLKERPEVAQLAYERARSKLRRPGSGPDGSAGTTPLVAPDPLGDLGSNATEQLAATALTKGPPAVAAASPDVPPAPAAGQPERTRRDYNREAYEIVLPALSAHHQYNQDGSILKYDPISLADLKRTYKTSKATASRWFKDHFGDHRAYIVDCSRDKGRKLREILRKLNQDDPESWQNIEDCPELAAADEEKPEDDQDE